MLNSQELQNAYNWFYECMREYVWDMDVVEILAELEVGVYDAFPDKEKLVKTAERLEREIREFYKDDEDLEKSFTELKELIDSDDRLYLPLYKVNEVLVKEDNDEDQENERMRFTEEDRNT